MNSRFVLKPPWWFCCGWFSPWCVIDTIMHECHLEWRWVCDRHDAKITGGSYANMDD
jgi:hypothetical protein